MSRENYPQAVRIIKENMYVDDILESVPDKKEARSVTKNVETLIGKGGFEIKG